MEQFLLEPLADAPAWDGERYQHKRCACPVEAWGSCPHPFVFRCAGCGEDFVADLAWQRGRSCSLSIGSAFVDFCAPSCQELALDIGALIDGTIIRRTVGPAGSATVQ